MNATRSFYSKNTDSRAQIITTLSSGSRLDTSALVIFYYDGAVRPASFAPFDDIAPLVNEVKAQSFSSFVASIPSKLAEVANFRGAFNTMCTSKLTLEFLKAVKNETDVSFAHERMCSVWLICGVDIRRHHELSWRDSSQLRYRAFSPNLWRESYQQFISA